MQRERVYHGYLYVCMYGLKEREGDEDGERVLREKRGVEGSGRAAKKSVQQQPLRIQVTQIGVVAADAASRSVHWLR